MDVWRMLKRGWACVGVWRVFERGAGGWCDMKRGVRCLAMRGCTTRAWDVVGVFVLSEVCSLLSAQLPAQPCFGVHLAQINFTAAFT